MRLARTVFYATLACAIPFTTGRASAVSQGREFSLILDVCNAMTLEEAAARGERLGWLAAPEDRNWRAAFERHNGGTVRVVGWRRSEGEGDDLLSYWVALGPNEHRACALSMRRPGLLEALRERFGTPDTFDEQGDIVSAFWQRDGVELSFTQVGMTSGLNLSRRS